MIFKKNYDTIILKTLENNELLAFPTDTVYGLACIASSKIAINKIYEVKKRNKSMPLILMIKTVDDIYDFVSIPKKYIDIFESLTKNYWPGDLTIILPYKNSTNIYCEHSTIGVRIPNNKIALEILNLYKDPIYVTSANISGHVTPNNAKDVEKEFNNKISLIIDGKVGSGTPSTIISILEDGIEFIRKGTLYTEINKILDGEKSL